MNSPITIKGVYLRKDLEEIISETFATRYNVNLENWIEPFAFYDQMNGSVICNEHIPDGVYVTLGKVTYPSMKRFSYFHIGQFNICRSRGVDLLWVDRFRDYPNLPETLQGRLQPKFPLFKVGNIKDYEKAKVLYKEVNKPLTLDELRVKIEKAQEIDPDSIAVKIYKLRKALQREIDKEK